MNHPKAIRLENKLIREMGFKRLAELKNPPLRIFGRISDGAMARIFLDSGKADLILPPYKSIEGALC